MRLFWKLFLAVLGWDTSVRFPGANLPKYVVIVGPHTSNWDFVIGLAYRSLLDLGHVKFLGKKELFRPPFGAWFQWLGGIPVDRSHSRNLVEETARLFTNNKTFALALSPEGTRSKVAKLRTGFYYIAQQAGVPIIMAGLDFSRKSIVFSEPFFATRVDDDFDRIVSFYRNVKGRHPELGIG